MKNLAALIAAVAIAACPVVATHAQDSDGRRTEAVAFGDLDLNNQEGAVTLFHRLRSAATNVCGQPSGAADYDTARRYKHCVDGAMSEAVATVDQPTVTSYAQGRGVSIKNSH